MRTIGLLGLAALVLASTSGTSEAARWCHSGAQARGCVFESKRECDATGRRVGGACRVQAAAPRAPASAYGQVAPSRPAWASPMECYMDDGYGRFRPCNAGGDIQ